MYTIFHRERSLLRKIILAHMLSEVVRFVSKHIIYYAISKIAIAKGCKGINS